ncbi:MAG TPA: hypothetical protein VFB90_07140 [Dehalococcoidia bacterium]|nr:hypothetical protein [Dehalococcoidia bacterium]
MIWHKGCPRCQGDVWVESDIYGDYVTCVQCGMLGEVSFLRRPRPQPSSKASKPERKMSVA